MGPLVLPGRVCFSAGAWAPGYSGVTRLTEALLPDPESGFSELVTREGEMGPRSSSEPPIPRRTLERLVKELKLPEMLKLITVFFQCPGSLQLQQKLKFWVGLAAFICWHGRLRTIALSPLGDSSRVRRPSRVVLVVKSPPANTGEVKDAGSVRGSGRSPGGGNGNPFQYSCLENLMDRGAWWVIVLRVANSRTRRKRLNTYTLGFERADLPNKLNMEWA